MGCKNLPGLQRKKEKADGLKEIGQCPGVADEVTTQPKRSGNQLGGQKIKVKNAETSDSGGERLWIGTLIRSCLCSLARTREDCDQVCYSLQYCEHQQHKLLRRNTEDGQNNLLLKILRVANNAETRAMQVPRLTTGKGHKGILLGQRGSCRLSRAKHLALASYTQLKKTQEKQRDYVWLRDSTVFLSPELCCKASPAARQAAPGAPHNPPSEPCTFQQPKEKERRMQRMVQEGRGGEGKGKELGHGRYLSSPRSFSFAAHH
ncbi:hypothetical protein PAL_GLEAN10007253 [Pteropus alecto]|uniref:Uncharacterized protein n=1 Tax=Pteropus alecto TaxID=9402 RepID=L5KBX7_PTEAL|nr:hypothetical protein PAL_GLEAN10007253 [Pteropus alecto]